MDLGLCFHISSCWAIQTVRTYKDNLKGNSSLGYPVHIKVDLILVENGNYELMHFTDLSREQFSLFKKKKCLRCRTLCVGYRSAESS